MKGNIQVVSAACGLIVALAGGCGFTGIGGGKQIDSLDEEDRVKICEETLEHFEKEKFWENSVRLLCVGQSAALVGPMGGDASACELAVMDCMKKSELNGPGDGDACSDTSNLTSCSATVREYEDCINEQVDAMSEAVEKVTCASVLNGTAPTGNPAPGPACEAMAKKCPDFFDNQGEGT